MAVALEIVSDPDQSIEALESAINNRSATFSAQDVAKAYIVRQLLNARFPPARLRISILAQQQQVQASVQQKSGGCMDQYVFRMPKHVSTTRLHDAWDVAASVSPALRTRTVSLRQGVICQVTVKATPGWNGEASLSGYLQWDRDFRIRHGGPLCRFGEVDQPDGKRYFVLSLHPAIYDPWTLSHILSAVMKAYDNDGEPLAPFQPFSAYIRRLSGRQNAQSAQDFWRARPPWSHEASLQFPRVPHGANEADLSNWKLLDIQMPITGSGDGGVPTTLAVLHAAWALCLSRLSGDSKAYFGVHVDSRGVSVEGIARMTGPVAAIVPCAIDLATLNTGDSLLGIVREHVNAVETSASHGIGITSQSFRNVLIVHNDPTSVQQTEPPQILELMQTRSSESSFDGARLVTRCTVISNETLRIEMQFDKRVVFPQDIDILLQQYKHAITQLLLKASALLADLDPLCSYERSLLLEWNTNSPSRVDACIQDQVRDITKRQPTAAAICSWDCNLDHGQLDDLSDRMAALL